jgi:hypothetical protein
VARRAKGEGLGGYIYGTIVVLSVIVAGARAFPEDPGHVAALVIVTCLTFWLAHVYSHALGQSITRGDDLSLAELKKVARREWSLVQAAVPPIVALLLGVLGIISSHAALWLAFGLGLTVLGVQGLVFARVKHLSPLGTLVVVAANLGLGLVLVALKLVVVH